MNNLSRVPIRPFARAGRSTRRRRGTLRALFLPLVGGLFLSLPLSAQSPPARISPGRFLLIVDTSAGMRPRAAATLRAVDNLLRDGMNAQLQRGDSIGVWTYNDQLHAGDLPLQRWTPENEHLVASNVLAFLKTRLFGNKPRFEAVRPELQRVVRESEKLTVLLVSDGSEPVSGTPFDARINEFFKQNAWPQKQKRMPFVTVLRSYRGKFAGVTLNLAPWPVEFPPFPPEPKVADQPKPKLPPKNTTPPPTAPPLIVVGEDHEPSPTAPAAPAEPAATQPAPAHTVAPAPQPAPPPVAPAAPNEPPAPTSSATTAPPKSDTASATLAPPETKRAPPTATSALPPPPAPAPAPTVAETPPAPAPAHPEELKSEPAAPPATPGTGPVAVATAPQTGGGFHSKFVWVICAAAAVLLVVLVLLMRRRAQAAGHVSLITRSMDQDKK
jgi:hypothetical protein